MFLSVLTRALSAASAADQLKERHAVAVAQGQALRGGICRNIREVFALWGFVLWLGKWDICTHMENEKAITRGKTIIQSSNPRGGERYVALFPFLNVWAHFLGGRKFARPWSVLKCLCRRWDLRKITYAQGN